MASQTNIDLYPQQSDPAYTITNAEPGTPNGHKVHIAFEELGIKYNVHKIDISKNTQKEEWFLKICPNGRIPAMVDKTSGKEKRVFEGGAMLLYLTDKYDKDNKISFDHDSDEYWETVEWIVWMQSGLGPMQGQANHFYRYAPEKIEYGINRYQTETKRLYQVLNDRLTQQEKVGQGLWLVGNKFTIADIACFSWVNWGAWAGIETKPFPEIERWLDAINARPAVQKGVNIPDEFKLKEIMSSKEKSEEHANKASAWVMKGQEEDQKKHA
ncbi:glutathione S-transferase GstA [Aureobasidium sp. EXF-10728]|nr:glutathione S-transferase GstA [Aureobasidium sp. EXF-10728]